MKTWSQALNFSSSTTSWKSEDASPGLDHALLSILLDASTRSKESPSYQDLKENLTVVSEVELVASCVQELVDVIFNNPNEAVYQNEAILMILMI
jgi:hypothetical protein